MAPIQLYNLGPDGVSVYVDRITVLLTEKGLPYEQVMIDYFNKPKEFVDLHRKTVSNPNHVGAVPLITDGDVVLTESDVIAEYLDNRYADHGTKLFPTDPYKLALVRLFVNNWSTLFTNNWLSIIMSTTKEEFKNALHAFTEALKVADAFLTAHGEEGGDFLLGNQFSYAEVAVLPFLDRAVLFLPKFRGVDVDSIIKENGLDRLAKWKEALFARKSVVDAKAPVDAVMTLGEQLTTVAREDLK